MVPDRSEDIASFPGDRSSLKVVSPNGPMSVEDAR